MDTSPSLAPRIVSRRIFPRPWLFEDASEITISALADYWDYFSDRMGTNVYYRGNCGRRYARKYVLRRFSVFNGRGAYWKICFDCIRL